MLVVFIIGVSGAVDAIVTLLALASLAYIVALFSSA
jgi:hypothetical protein